MQKAWALREEEEVTNDAEGENRIVASPLPPAPSDGGKRKSRLLQREKSLGEIQASKCQRKMLSKIK